MQDFKLATLNINRIESDVKFQCFKDYLQAAEIDIALVQEVISTKIGQIFGYTSIINIGPEAGTAILCKEGIQFTTEALLRSGRGISISIQDLLLVNIYAPSGSNNRMDGCLGFNVSSTAWSLETELTLGVFGLG